MASSGNSWCSFADQACSDVLLVILEYVPCVTVLKLACTSAPMMACLAQTSDACERSVAVRRVAAQFGLGVGQSPTSSGCSHAAEQAVKIGTSSRIFQDLVNSMTSSGSLNMLRMMASSIAISKALRSAVDLVMALQLHDVTDVGIATLTNSFLVELFRAETQIFQNTCPAGKSSFAMACDAALTSVLNSAECRQPLLQSLADQMRCSDDHITQLVEDGRISLPGQYESIACLRSSVEFICQRLEKSDHPGSPSRSSRELDSAIQALDETIDGYMIEGYDLSCPRFSGHALTRRLGVPYTHWWIHAGGRAGPQGLMVGREHRLEGWARTPW